ncbi:ABC transporter permease [Streptomyces sp. NPDC021056]|uniref:ABC transporter permease n=1 Tax=Streptomyces sp. NPDC021056 TaxID=3155012 RepID=UPI0033C0C60A
MEARPRRPRGAAPPAVSRRRRSARLSSQQWPGEDRHAPQSSVRSTSAGQHGTFSRAVDDTVQTRRTGVYARSLAAQVSARTLVLGETIAYLLLALLQALLIVAVGALAFGVAWGDPIAAAVLVAVWALVGTGAGVLAGAVFRPRSR